MLIRKTSRNYVLLGKTYDTHHHLDRQKIIDKDTYIVNMVGMIMNGWQAQKMQTGVYDPSNFSQYKHSSDKFQSVIITKLLIKKHKRNNKFWLDKRYMKTVIKIENI